MQSEGPLRIDEAKDDEVHQLAPTITIRMAAGLVTLVGFLSALSGFQLMISVRFYSPWVSLAPWAMLLLGLPTMYVGTQLYRMHGWAAFASIGVMALFALGFGAWTLFSVTSGMLSCLTIVAPFLSVIAFALSVNGLAACRRADQVRERLRDAGMDLGI